MPKTCSRGVEILFSEIEVVLTLASLDRLEAISLHPVLCLHMRYPVYTPDRLGLFDDESLDEWKFRLYEKYISPLSNEGRVDFAR